MPTFPPRPASMQPPQDTTTWGTVFFDHDNDMWLDLFYVNGDIFAAGLSDANIFMHNNGGDGTFTDLSVSSGLNDSGRGRSGSIADFDGDGFVDLMVGNYDEEYLLFHNRGDNGANWLTITVEGTVSNRDGIGTRLTLTRRWRDPNARNHQRPDPRRR